MKDSTLKCSNAPPESQEASALKLIVADDLGRIRVCEAAVERPDALKQTQMWGEADRARGIESMAVSSSSAAEEAGVAYTAVGRSTGECEVREVESGAVVATIGAAASSLEGQEGHNSIRGLHILSSQEPNSRMPMLLSCTASGLIRIHQPSESGEDSSWQLSTSWQCPAGVLAMAVCEETGQVAVACKGAELSVWSLQTQQRTFQAKGAKPNRVGLHDRPWNTAVAFLPGSGVQGFVVGTGQHQVRTYHVSQRRPKLSVQFGEARITALAPTPDGLRCWAADSQGQIGCVDLTAGKVLHLLKGCAGSVRSLSLHPSAPLVASAGLDRFLRIHDLRSRKSVARMFMKNQLVAAIFCPVVVRKEPQPANPSGVEANKNEALVEPAKPVKGKKRKGSGDGMSKPKKSKQNTNDQN